MAGDHKPLSGLCRMDILKYILIENR
jgi:hypothetical protein